MRLRGQQQNYQNLGSMIFRHFQDIFLNYIFVALVSEEMMIEHVVVAELALAEELTQAAVEIQEDWIHFVGVWSTNFLVDFGSSDAKNPSQIVGQQIFDNSIEGIVREVELGLLFRHVLNCQDPVK